MTPSTPLHADFLEPLTPKLEEKIKRIPFLDIDTYIIPSPYIRHKNLDKDYDNSYVWNALGEILGYLLVYSDKKEQVYHLYKQVTSPFGRGQGIGLAFIEKLISRLPEHAIVYLYVWEKQIDSIDFFTHRGFTAGDQIVYRHQSFILFEAKAGEIRERITIGTEKKRTEKERLGKVRHDARKNLQLLLDMVNMLSVDNCTQIIENINRESTSLINLLNDYGDRIKPDNKIKINLRDLIMERMIPYVEAAAIPCAINLHLENRIPTVEAHYVDVGRALINLAANSLDAIEEANRKGMIDIVLRADDDVVTLKLRDNGTGMPPDRLALNEEGLPNFVGKTTKGIDAGEGYGTKQVFATFGASNIEVTSEFGTYLEWNIMFKTSAEMRTVTLSERETRYMRLVECDTPPLTKTSSIQRIRDFIWHTRDIELLCYDLVFQFSMHNNIRDIYRSILAFRYGGKGFKFMKSELEACRTDVPGLREQLLKTLQKITDHEKLIRTLAGPELEGDLFKSYGRADRFTIIFTLDPENGRFYCSDRKLAEHLDLAAYLGKDREMLLRGEINGDACNLTDPIILGVWSTRSREELEEKLKLIRQGARKMIEIGFPPKKRLGFYNTTYNVYEDEIDSYKKTTLEDMANSDDDSLYDFVVSADNELAGFVFAD